MYLDHSSGARRHGFRCVHAWGGTRCMGCLGGRQSCLEFHQRIPNRRNVHAPGPVLVYATTANRNIGLPVVMWFPKFWRIDSRRQTGSSLSRVLKRMELLDGPHGMYGTVFGERDGIAICAPTAAVEGKTAAGGEGNPRQGQKIREGTEMGKRECLVHILPAMLPNSRCSISEQFTGPH